jgi:hypothetical protein
MRFATSCWLLVALTAATALAQTHPQKQGSREPATRQKAGRTRQQLAEGAFIQNTYKGLNHNDELARHTQPATLDSSQVYTYVEQMPTLNGQLGFPVITAAIQQHLLLPPDAPTGRTFVQFVVTKAGVVTKPRIVKGLRADVDSAVVAATRKLPRFTPGSQNGRMVPVYLTLPVPIVGQQP